MIDLPTNSLSRTIRILVHMSGELLTGGTEEADIFPPDVKPTSYGYYTKIKVTKFNTNLGLQNCHSNSNSNVIYFFLL